MSGVRQGAGLLSGYVSRIAIQLLVALFIVFFSIHLLLSSTGRFICVILDSTLFTLSTSIRIAL